MRFAILALMAAMALPGTAAAQPAAVAALLSIESDLNSYCRGWSGSEKHTDEVCATRDKATKALGALGWCYGKEGQFGAQMSWHKCTANSLR